MTKTNIGRSTRLKPPETTEEDRTWLKVWWKKVIDAMKWGMVHGVGKGGRLDDRLTPSAYFGDK